MKSRKSKKLKSKRDKKSIISNRIKILDALNNKDFIARTIPGIAKEAQIRVPAVIQIIESDPELNKIVKVYPRKTKNNLVLLTTRENFSKRASLKDKFIDFFATSRPEFEDAK